MCVQCVKEQEASARLDKAEICSLLWHVHMALWELALEPQQASGI